MFYLWYNDGSGSWQCIPAQGDITIGRSPDNVLQISEPTVSSRHAFLKVTPDGYWLTDLGSANGTRLMGSRLPARQAVRIQPGQEMRIGKYHLQVSDAPPQPVQPVRSAPQADLSRPGQAVAGEPKVGAPYPGAAPQPYQPPPVMQAKNKRPSRLPFFIGGGVLMMCCGAAAVLILFSGLLWGNTPVLPPSVGDGTLPADNLPPFPEGQKPPLIALTALDSTDIADNGQTVTDAHNVSALVPEKSLVDTASVHLVANDLPAAFDQEVEKQEGWKRTSPVYRLELDENGDMLGKGTLTFPDSSPEDRVAVLLDRRYFVVLNVLPEDGKLTVQAAVKPGGDEIFEGEGEVYYRVSKAGSAWNGAGGRGALRAPASLLFARMDPLQEGWRALMQAAAPCVYHNWRIYTECWNADHSISLTINTKLDPGNYSDMEKFLNKAADIMAGYRGLQFTNATPTPGEPVYIVVDSSSKDPRYTPALIGSNNVYIGWRSIFFIDEMVEQQTLAHELFHWVEHHTYPMRIDGNIPVMYWHLEVRAEAASFMLNPAYQAARLLTVGSILQNDAQGVLGWQKAPWNWDADSTGRPAGDPGRYVQGQVVRLMFCTVLPCLNTQQDFVDDINAGTRHWGITAYRDSLENTARFLLGAAPFEGVDVSDPILKTGRGYGDYIHASKSSMSKFVAVYSSTNLNKDAATSEVSIQAVIASGGLYPLRVSNGADVPIDSGPNSAMFGGESLNPNVPYNLYIDAGVAFYYRLGSGAVQYHDGSKAINFAPISSQTVKFRSLDGTYSDVPGIPSIRIVAINPTEEALTLTGYFVPLPPAISADPEKIILQNPKDEVKIQVTVSQIARVVSPFTAVWDYGDGSPEERVKVKPDSNQQAVIAVKHVFQSVGAKEVRVYFLDEKDKPLPWDVVIIPLGGELPTNFNVMSVEMIIAGSWTRTTRLYNLKIHMTGSTTFELVPGETRIKSLTGEFSKDGKTVSVIITYLPDPDVGVVESCPNVTILKNFPLVQQDSSSKVINFAVYGWDNILAAIEDTYPYLDNKKMLQCKNTEGWSQNADIQPNPMFFISFGYP